MTYPRKIEGLVDWINRFARHKAEMGSAGVQDKIDEIEQILLEKTAELEALPEAPDRAAEPSGLVEIRAASPPGNVRFDRALPDAEYLSKLRGAIAGRFAGCALGAPVELLSLEQLEAFAAVLGVSFPPENYWPDAPRPYAPRYKVGLARDFTLPHMRALPPDDDITYTFLALLILERFGGDFGTSDVAESWLAYLPPECTFTAERITLANLRAGLPAELAGATRNPDCELIGAAIRCDGWAYVNPLDPERASEFAHRDAFLSHRRSGIYSAMYFAAVIASAFGTASVEEALEIGLRFIPVDCEFSRQVRWALEMAPQISDFRAANRAVSERFAGMHPVHSINNACLTIWGARLGQGDFSRGISQTVGMAYDNDCTAATVGSILGAFHGIDGVPEFWYRPWNNTAVSYLHGIDSFDIANVVDRFHTVKRSLEGQDSGGPHDASSPIQLSWPSSSVG